MPTRFLNDDDRAAAELEKAPAFHRLRQERQEQDHLNLKYQQQTPPQPIRQPIPQGPQRPTFMSPFEVPQETFLTQQTILEQLVPVDCQDPRLRLGLYGQTRGETSAMYNVRLENALKILGYQYKPKFVAELDPNRHPTESSYANARQAIKARLQKEHRRMIDPTDNLYSEAYAARWLAQKKARHAHNEPIMAQILAKVREWQASTGRERQPTPEPEDSGDDLYPTEIPQRLTYRCTVTGKQVQKMYKCWGCKKSGGSCTYLETGVKPCESCIKKDCECIEADYGVPDPQYISDRLDEMGTDSHASTGDSGLAKRSKSPGRLNIPKQNVWKQTARRRNPKEGRDYDAHGKIMLINYENSSGQEQVSRGRSASPVREIENKCRNCVLLGLKCDMGRPCRNCLASSSWGEKCHPAVQDPDYRNTEIEEFGFAQPLPGNVCITPAPPTATPDKSLAHDSDDAWIHYLTELNDTMAYYDRVDPTLRNVPQASPWPEVNSISAYSDAAPPPDPFQDALFLDEGLNPEFFNDPNPDNGQFGVSPPEPQQELEISASTWGQTDHPAVSEIPYNMFGDFDVEAPYDFVFDPDFDPNEMMDTLAPNSATDYPPLLESPDEMMDISALDSVANYPNPPNSPHEMMDISLDPVFNCPALPEFPPETPDVPPHRDQLLPGIVGAYGASWEIPGSFKTLKHIDVLSGYPDTSLRPIIDYLEEKGCSELSHAFPPESNEKTTCGRKRTRRCQFQHTAAYELDWQAPENHMSGELYYTCECCHQDQRQEAKEWEVEAKEAMKAFVCAGCAGELTSQQKTRLATCVCLDKLKNDWLCHTHRRRGYQQIVLCSGVVGHWLVQVGNGIQMCPRCYLNPDDERSKVYACKTCRTYVEEA